MSAYLVEPITINRIVTWMTQEASKEHSEVKEALKKAGIPLKNREDCHNLANAFLAMNKESVDSRYGQDTPIQPIEFIPVSSYNIQIVKSMHCLSYQSCEGDVPEKNPLYKLLEEIIKILELRIIFELPQYDEAKWG